jgi:hypothetical protein
MANGGRPRHKLSIGRTIHAVFRNGRRIPSAARISVLDATTLDTLKAGRDVHDENN